MALWKTTPNTNKPITATAALVRCRAQTHGERLSFGSVVNCGGEQPFPNPGIGPPEKNPTYSCLNQRDRATTCGFVLVRAHRKLGKKHDAQGFASYQPADTYGAPSVFFAVKQATAGFKCNNFQPGQIASKLASHQEEEENPPRHKPDDRDETSIERERERACGWAPVLR